MRLLIQVFIIFMLAGCDTTKQVTSASGGSSKNSTTENPKNIIFLIGDGMGLSQISGGMYLNKNRTALEDFPYVGLHKSYSADNLVTDSAAGATAFSAGVKTYNGAIGVDINKKPVKTILEEAEEKGLKTGLVASSSIVHATPASFFAHNESRKNYEEIAIDFLNTEVDIFIGGGKAYFDRREDGRNLYEELAAKGYIISDYFTKSLSEVKFDPNKKHGFLTADTEPLSYEQGRDYLIEAAQKSITYLDKASQGKGFFLMIEGAQIDWGGHANDANYVLSEFKEFDQVIQKALAFAKKDGNTLVIVTADHETGGFAINPQSTMDSLNISFTTGGHTATMIPVFAYGPGARMFTGMYENTAIYDKMRAAFGF